MTEFPRPELLAWRDYGVWLFSNCEADAKQATPEPPSTAPVPEPQPPKREGTYMQSICPNCEKHDEIYIRSGGALVCRECA